MKFLKKILFLCQFSYILMFSQDLFNVRDYLNKEELINHVEYLGSDELEGRGTGTKGGEKTAGYLANEFEKLNLLPLGNNNSYFQYIQMHGLTPGKSSKMKLYSDNDTIDLNLWEDYLLHSGGDPTFIPNPLPLVFAGYGISAPEFDYNDYQSIDANGKIVVVLAGEPKSENASFFEGSESTIYGSTEAKRRTAISYGARGMIEIPNLAEDPYINWNRLINTYSFEYVTLAYSVTANLSFVINPGSAHVLFNNSCYKFADIFEMHKSGEMKSFPLNVSLSFKGDFARRDFIASNVIGMIEGSDEELKDSYIIVSAHYDHLGIGPAVAGDSIYNGVYDNAIGTAAVLELAGAVSKMEMKPKRSIIFLLTTGEEHGLLGSIYYIDHPVVPLYKTIANINIDGVASFDNFNSIIGVGIEYSTLKNFFEKTAEGQNLSVIEIPSMFKKSESFTQSDQRSFIEAGIPSILTMDGLDYKNISTEKGIEMFIDYSQRYYHTPFDDLSLPLNYDAAVQHIEFIYNLLMNIASSKTIPEWNKNSPYLNARLRSIAEKR